MKAIKISSQWWVVREDASERGFTIVAGPFPEEWQAVSACRLNDTWQ